MSDFCKGRFWPSLVRIFPLKSTWILRPLGVFDRHHTQKFWSNFVQSYCVRTLAYGTWLRSLINAPCLPGVDSGDPVRKLTRHHVACTAREGTLLWILAKLLVHAPYLDWGRFWRSGQKANRAHQGLFPRAQEVPRLISRVLTCVSLSGCLRSSQGAFTTRIHERQES